MTNNEKKIEEGKRLEIFIKSLNIRPNKFAKEIGVSQPLISQVKNGTRQFTRELANKIAARYPKFKESWIYTGEGSMLKESYMVESYQNEVGTPRTLEDLKKDNESDPLSGLRALIERVEELERWKARLDAQEKMSPNKE